MSPDLPADDLLHFNPDRAITLPGSKCAYCGTKIEGRGRTKDHVIARNFVPQGAIADGFNLIVQSCRPCNDRKARLEDDISLITMLPDTAGNLVRDDPRLRATIARKSKGSVSAATRKLAAESYPKINFRMPVRPGLALTYDGVARPSIDEQRVARLAYFHVQGFAFFRSFNRERGHGAWLEPGEFLTLGYLTESDWGNPRMRHFVERIQNFDRVAHVAAADGYFRHVMRKMPDRGLWAWALEWNERYRVFGLYGEKAARDDFVSSMPSVEADLSWGNTQNGFVMRIDTPLGSEEDLLFDLSGVAEPTGFAQAHWREAAGGAL